MERFAISGPGLVLTWALSDGVLRLVQMSREAGDALLHTDEACSEAGPGPAGNPMALVVNGGPHAGVHGMDAFEVSSLTKTDCKLLAYLNHRQIPLSIGLEVSVEGNVAVWRGQVCWNGDEPLDAYVLYPLFSRISFAGPGADRALFPHVSGSVQGPLGAIDYANSYLGGLSVPTFLMEGGGAGMAFVDENMADFAADPGACVRRTYVVANMPLTGIPGLVANRGYRDTSGTGAVGPYAGVCHSRVFHPVSRWFPGERDVPTEFPVDRLPMPHYGDAADLGPTLTYAYMGTWKEGARWVKERRRHVAFRSSPAEWYRNCTFISEDLGDAIVREGKGFREYPVVMAEKETLGSNVFHLPGYHDAELIGMDRNWLNRGDYFLAADNMGGFEAVRQGVEAVHRRGGRILYYVEGLIMWKRSRIGRSQGRKWALMKADGTHTEHYQGFWHMCPSCPEWRRWLAQTCADIVRTTGIDGFFIDSSCATDNHRCYNPDHNHPHPDVWNWGLRQMMKEVREAVDRVNPNTVIFVEGAGDMAREFVDGFVSHTHMWTGQTFGEPLVRFIHPQMRAFESWGSNHSCSPDEPIQWKHIWNSVTGHRIYAHNDDRFEMAQLSRHTRTYSDSYPEVWDNAMSMADVETHGCMAQLFEGEPMVMTVGNLSAEACEARVVLPAGIACGMLFDRVDGLKVPVRAGEAQLTLDGWGFRALELRA